LIRNLCDIASKGGNFLLNVGPTAQGLIPAPSVERLAAMGAWLKRNGEAIYATGPSPFPQQLSWGRATTRPGKIYLHVFDWPQDGALRLPALAGSARRAVLLADRRRVVEITVDADGVTLRSPGPAPDAPVSVIAVEVGRRRAA
jgi:alpha-L-fucosidase